MIGSRRLFTSVREERHHTLEGVSHECRALSGCSTCLELRLSPVVAVFFNWLRQKQESPGVGAIAALSG